MKVAVIGLGGISQKYYLPILSGKEGLDLQILARTNESIQKTQSVWNIARAADSISDVIHWKPEVAFVLTPSATHYEIVKTLLENEVDVFVEKPATLQVEQTMELAELSARMGRICMVGFNRRYSPLHQRGKDWWEKRKVEFATFSKFRKNPFHKNARDHIYDDTIHIIDIMRFFCGEGELIHKELRMEEQIVTIAGIFRLENGGIATIVNTMRSGEWREEYTLTGDGSTLDIQAFSALSVYQETEQLSWKENYGGGDDPLVGRGFSGEIDHFLSCVKTRKNPQTDLSDSIRTQRLVEKLAE